MSVLTPTYDTGARTKPSPVVYAPPRREMTDDMLVELLGGLGVNPAFVADIMSAALTHERCGRHLYRSVAGRTANPVLKAKYQHFGNETERHVEVLETLVIAMGGDPNYVSPAARATEAADARILESTFLLSGSVDLMAAEMTMLDAVLLAETIDHNNWRAMADLAGELPDGELRDQFAESVASVMADEENHLEWAAETRLKMIRLQASSSPLAAAGAKVEEMVAVIGGWFSGE